MALLGVRGLNVATEKAMYMWKEELLQFTVINNNHKLKHMNHGMSIAQFYVTLRSMNDPMNAQWQDMY